MLRAVRGDKEDRVRASAAKRVKAHAKALAKLAARELPDNRAPSGVGRRMAGVDHAQSTTPSCGDSSCTKYQSRMKRLPWQHAAGASSTRRCGPVRLRWLIRGYLRHSAFGGGSGVTSTRVFAGSTAGVFADSAVAAFADSGVAAFADSGVATFAGSWVRVSISRSGIKL
jgi:hypothetical protein